MGASAVPLDYEHDPARFRATVRAVERYGLSGDVHAFVAERFAAEGLERVLDLGCGEGRLTHPLRTRGVTVVALDYAATMLAAVLAPRVRGDARRIPMRHDSFDGVAALYMLYHLTDPREALAESCRVLRLGGLFAACAPSRFNDPELADVLPQSAATFDAENGVEMMGEFFQFIEVARWDAPLVHLPDREALALYLKGRGLSPAEIASAVERVATPLTLTKRGALCYGRKLMSFA